MKRAIAILSLLCTAVIFASAQPVTANLTATSAACATANSCVSISGVNINAVIAVQVTGTFVGTMAFEGTVDGTNWVAMAGTPSTVAATRVLTTTAAGIWQINVSGYYKFRVRCSAYTSGTATITMRRSNYPALAGAAT